MFKIFLLNELSSIKIDIKPWNIVFLYWDLAAWKTTITKHIINNILKVKEQIKSPTYTYYNEYIFDNNKKIYHFDLYRIKKYDEFFAIWWEDILDNIWDNIAIIEWPDIIERFYNPNLKIFLKKTWFDDKREILIEKN